MFVDYELVIKNATEAMNLYSKSNDYSLLKQILFFWKLLDLAEEEYNMIPSPNEDVTTRKDTIRTWKLKLSDIFMRNISL